MIAAGLSFTNRSSAKPAWTLPELGLGWKGLHRLPQSIIRSLWQQAENLKKTTQTVAQQHLCFDQFFFYVFPVAGIVGPRDIAIKRIDHTVKPQSVCVSVSLFSSSSLPHWIKKAFVIVYLQVGSIPRLRRVYSIFHFSNHQPYKEYNFLYFLYSYMNLISSLLTKWKNPIFVKLLCILSGRARAFTSGSDFHDIKESEKHSDRPYIYYSRVSLGHEFVYYEKSNF